MDKHFDKSLSDNATISLVEDLLQRTKYTSTTRRHFETLVYLKQCKFLAPYNAFLVMQQRSCPTVVMTAEQWANRYGREPIAGVPPIVILRPFGPVAFVYDIEDTRGNPLTDVPPNLPTPELIRRIFPSDGWTPGLDELYLRIVNAARNQGAAVTEALFVPEHSGRVSFIPSFKKVSKKQPLEDYHIEINTFHPIEVKLCGLVHELAHIYCEHFGNRRPKDEKEVEAEAVAYAFCYRRGFRPRSEEYLIDFLVHDKPMPVGFWDTVLTSLKKIEGLVEAKEENEGLAPLTFHAQIGGYLGNSYAVRLHGDKLVYEVFNQGYKLESTAEVKVSSEAWAKFWLACKKYKVWDWSEHYSNPGCCDGTQWGIVIETPFRRLESSGDNAFPASTVFNHVLKAISKLLGGRTFE